MSNRFRALLSVPLLLILACRPVITIGWKELAVSGLLIVLLLGPPFYRLLRALEKYRDKRDK